METIIITTKPWMVDAAKKEIEDLVDRKVKTTSTYHLTFKTDTIIADVLELMYYSRRIEGIYLHEDDVPFISETKTFEVDASGHEDKDELEKELGSNLLEKHTNLRVDLSNPQLTFKVLEDKTVALDLLGFSLGSRKYKVNTNVHCLNALVVQKLIYSMKLPKLEEISIIDPLANLGDCIVEAGLYCSDYALHTRKRFSIPLTLFSKQLPLPGRDEGIAKLQAVVQDNKVFKQFKENITQSGLKVKVSQYELDWLDVKFHEADFDYVITSIPFIQDENELEEIQNQLLYQSEFIVKNKIGIITRQPLDAALVKKNKLKISSQEEVRVGEQKYYLYVLL